MENTTDKEVTIIDSKREYEFADLSESENKTVSIKLDEDNQSEGEDIEISDQEDSDQEDGDQEDSDQEDSDQEDSDQEDSDQEDSDQEDSDQQKSKFDDSPLPYIMMLFVAWFLGMLLQYC